MRVSQELASHSSRGFKASISQTVIAASVPFVGRQLDTSQNSRRDINAFEEGDIF